MEKNILRFSENGISACDLEELGQIQELSDMALACVGGGIGDTTLGP
jgi:hypothetical protein